MAGTPTRPALHSWLRFTSDQVITVTKGGANVITLSAGSTYLGLWECMMLINDGVDPGNFYVYCDPDSYRTKFVTDASTTFDVSAATDLQALMGLSSTSYVFSASETGDTDQLSVFYPLHRPQRKLPTIAAVCSRGRAHQGTVWSTSLAGDENRIMWDLGVVIRTDSNWDEYNRFDLFADSYLAPGIPFSWFDDAQDLNGDMQTGSTSQDLNLQIRADEMAVGVQRISPTLDNLFGRPFMAWQVQLRS